MIGAILAFVVMLTTKRHSPPRFHAVSIGGYVKIKNIECMENHDTSITKPARKILILDLNNAST